MTASLKTQISAKPSDVRVWGAAHGFNVKTRGSISFDLYTAYNKANSVKYLPSKYVATRKVEVKVKGRNVTRTTTPAAVRDILKNAGESVGSRGRLSNAHYQRAFDLTNA